MPYELNNSLFQGDVTSSNNNESAIFRRWKSKLKWRMLHRLNDKVDNSLTEIPGCPEKRIVKLKQYRSCNHCILFLFYFCGQFSEEEMWWWESMFGGCPGGGEMLFLITNGWQVITFSILELPVQLLFHFVRK